MSQDVRSMVIGVIETVLSYFLYRLKFYFHELLVIELYFPPMFFLKLRFDPIII